MKHIKIFTILMLLPFALISEEFYGFTFGSNYSITKANNIFYPNYSNLGIKSNLLFDFKSESLLFPQAGIFAYLKLDKGIFAGLEFTTTNSSYISDAKETITIVGENGLAQQVEFDHNININQLNIGLSGNLRLNLFSDLNLSFGAGVFLNNLKFDYRQQATEPRLRTLYPIKTKSGAEEGINNPLYNVSSNLSYDIYLNRKFIISPRIGINYQLNELFQNSAINNLRANLNIDFTFRNFHRNIVPQEIILRDTVIKIRQIENGKIEPDTVVFFNSVVENMTTEDEENIYEKTFRTDNYIKYLSKPKPLLTGTIQAKFKDINGEEASETKIKVKQKLIAKYMPKGNVNLSKFKKTDYNETIDSSLFANVPSIKFYIDYLAEAGLVKWDIEVEKDNVKIHNLTGNEDSEKAIEWKIGDKYTIDNLLQQKFHFKYYIEDSEQQRIMAGKGSFSFDYELDRSKNKGFSKVLYYIKSNNTKCEQLAKYLEQIISKATETKVKIYLSKNLNFSKQDLDKHIKKGFEFLQSPDEYTILELE